MTAAAILEIQIAAEGSAAVVTGRARIVAGREVFRWPRGAHLSPLRQSGGVVVTVGAIQTLARAVLRVTERIAESDGGGGSARVRFLIMASFAGSDVTAVGLRAGRMTGVALIMRRETCGDRQRCAASQR